MKDPKLAQQSARNEVLKLLSDEEIARVSNAEGTNGLAEGQEYVDLEHLDRGAQRAKAQMTIAMGHILPRRAVSDATWTKILAHLAS